MVGLTDLGEVAWQCEQVMNKWLKDEKPATTGLLAFVELAERSFSGWIASLKEGRDTPIDGAEIARRAEQLKSGEAAMAPPARLESLPPEPEAEAAVAVTEVAEEPAPAEAAAGGFTFESLELQPAAEEEAAAPAGEAPAPEEEPDVVVGSVSLSSALYSIYVGEAEQHVAALEREMAAIEADPLHPVSHEFMRAAHTLTAKPSLF